MIIMKKQLYLVFILLAATFAGCQEDPLKKEPVPPAPVEGTGHLALRVAFEGMAATRAEENTNEGLPGERRLKELRFILYGADGIAKYVDNYRYDDDFKEWVSLDPYTNPATGTVTPAENGDLLVTFLNLDKAEYKLVVVANPGEHHQNLYSIRLDDTRTLGEETETAGTQNTLDLWEADYLMLSDDDEDQFPSIPFGVFSKLIGFHRYTFDGDVHQAFDMGTGFLMTNADGITEIKAADFHNTPEEALEHPKTIYVERTAAKVAVFKGADIIRIDDECGSCEEFLLPNGDKIGKFQWAPDIINNHTYVIRKPARTAPANNLAEETLTTLRKYRYATSPTMNGYSREKYSYWGNDYGPTPDPQDHYYYIQSDDDPCGGCDINGMRNWIENLAYFTEHDKWYSEDECCGAPLWDYVTENTFAAEEQYEDITTRILFAVQYYPQHMVSVDYVDDPQCPSCPEHSYFAYEGFIFGYSDVEMLVNGEATLPADLLYLHPQLQELQLIIDEMMGTPQIFEDFYVTNMREYKGLKFYYEGINYYSVPLRHFDDQLSSGDMNYGRYGVVRNNVYKVIIHDILGLGSPTVPAPQGPDDKESNLEVEMVVKNWEPVTLKFDL